MLKLKNIFTLVLGLVSFTTFAQTHIQLSECEPVYQFTNLSFANGDSVISAHWDFGDGETSKDYHAAHQFDTTGHYQITLTVGTSNGCTLTLSKLYYFELINMVNIKADFIASNDTIFTDNPILTLVNTSQDFTGFGWYLNDTFVDSVSEGGLDINLETMGVQGLNTVELVVTNECGFKSAKHSMDVYYISDIGIEETFITYTAFKTQIYDMSGRMVMKGKSDNIGDYYAKLPAGMYAFVVWEKGSDNSVRTQTQKVTIVR